VPSFLAIKLAGLVERVKYLFSDDLFKMSPGVYLVATLLPVAFFLQKKKKGIPQKLLITRLEAAFPLSKAETMSR